MKRPDGRTRILFRLWFYIGATLFVVVVWQIQNHVAATYLENWKDGLTALEERQLDAFLEMNRLLTTLGTALLGGIGFLLRRAPARAAGRSRKEGLTPIRVVGPNSDAYRGQNNRRGLCTPLRG